MASTIRFDPGVVPRYANLEPRIRGYPDVPALYGNVDASQYPEGVKRSNDALIPRPVVLRVHIPEEAGAEADFVAGLARETELVAPLFDDDRDVVDLGFCGSPDRLGRGALARLVDTVVAHFRVTDASRFGFSIELAATRADPARIAASRSAGASRTDVVLAFGLARQAHHDLATALGQLLDTRPDRICLRDIALTEACRQAARVADAPARLAMLEFAVNELVARGYRHAGRGEFVAAEEDRQILRHDLVGIGPGAMSRFGDRAFENATDIRRWRERVGAHQLPLARGFLFGVHDRLRADVLRQLLYAGRVDVAPVERRFRARFADVFAAAIDNLRQLEALGLAGPGDECPELTSHGRYLWHIIAACFDPDYRSPHGAGQRIECDVEESQRGDVAQ